MIDLLIVGAGPAGLSAAITASDAGMKVTVIDEFPRAGGRLIGQLYQKPDGEWWNGIELSDELREEAENAGVELMCEVSVYDLEKRDGLWMIYTNKETFEAENLLLATGSTEKALPMEGWTLPGVMSIGAAQVMANVHRVKPGEDCIVIGANVLSISIAHELVMAGINVKSIILPSSNLLSGDAGIPVKVMQSLMKLTHLAPGKVMRQLGKIGKKVPPKFALRFFPEKGIEMLGVLIRIKTAALEITGDEEAKGVWTVQVDAKGNPVKDTEKFEEADLICIAGGLSPLVELASVAGCNFEYSERLGGHIPVHNEKMQTDIEGLYVAGNITGIESANVAMAQGTVAGYSASLAKKPEDERLSEGLKSAVETVVNTRNAALIEFQPGINEERKKSYSKNAFDTDKEREEINA